MRHPRAGIAPASETPTFLRNFRKDWPFGGPGGSGEGADSSEGGGLPPGGHPSMLSDDEDESLVSSSRLTNKSDKNLGKEFVSILGSYTYTRYS